MQAIKLLLVPEFASMELLINNKYYCLDATNALIKYVEFTENFWEELNGGVPGGRVVNNYDPPLPLLRT